VKGKDEEKKEGARRKGASTVIRLLELANGVWVRMLVTVPGLGAKVNTERTLMRQHLSTESKMCRACVACRVSPCPV
jgi:hypothetical protein